MLEFLIFGSKKCQACQSSKILLDDEQIDSLYIDLKLFYDDLKNALNNEELGRYINGQKTIPLIFKKSDDGDFVLPDKFCITETEGEGEDSLYHEKECYHINYKDLKWTFIGGFNELKEELKYRWNTYGITLDDNY